MSLVYAPRRKVESAASIITPRVRRAQYELIEALSESVRLANLETIDEAEARMSAIMGDIWNEVELNARCHIVESIARKDDQ